ncbi:hypothetical protein N9D31_01040 [Oligoflexaceae bacterium]|nr:hypothetical protein [Oligoflexaceae bacterium]
MKTLTSVLCLLQAANLFAGQVFQQTVHLDKSNVSETHTWYLSKKKFRLEISEDNRQVIYIFTGRSLLACLKGVNRNAKSKIPPSWSAAIKNGVCLVAPVNLMTHFLISPLHMQFFLQTSESMQSQLTIEEYNTSSKESAEVSKIKCVNGERDYKFSNVRASKTYSVTGGEKGCYLQTPWRKGLWREVSRRLLQQPKARETRQKLTKNKIGSLGLLLQGESNFKESSSKSPWRHYRIRMVKSESRKIPSGYFRKPSTFEMISTLQSKSGTVARLSKQDKTSESESDKDLGLDDLIRMFVQPLVIGR